MLRTPRLSVSPLKIHVPGPVEADPDGGLAPLVGRIGRPEVLRILQVVEILGYEAAARRLLAPRSEK